MREAIAGLIPRAYRWVRSLLEREERPAAAYRLRWVIVEGGARAGIDLDDRGALTDLMNERSDDLKSGDR